jgi:hypothetical protein
MLEPKQTALTWHNFVMEHDDDLRVNKSTRVMCVEHAVRVEGMLTNILVGKRKEKWNMYV